MKKRSLMAMLLVGAMLVGCGGSASAGSDAGNAGNATAENQQSSVSSEVAVDDTTESGVDDTEFTGSLVATEIGSIETNLPEDLPLSTETVESSGTSEGTLTDFFGLKVTEYGVDGGPLYSYPDETAETGMLGVYAENIATKEVGMTEDGKYKQTVTYNFKPLGGYSVDEVSDWTLFIFDAKTGDNFSLVKGSFTPTFSHSTPKIVTFLGALIPASLAI